MRHELELPLHRRARVWIGAFPGDGYDITATHTRTVSCSSGTGDPCVFAVEIVVPRGPMISYGLLGVRYEPGKDDLEVTVREGTGAAAEHALVSRDTVTWGMPDEFAEAVIRTVGELEHALPLPCGRLSFECAAFGEIGSSPRLFGVLTEVLLRAVAEPQRPTGADDWSLLLQEAAW